MRRSTVSLRLVSSVALAIVALSWQLNGQERPDDAAWQRYSFILRTSTLEWLFTDPFLVRVEFQLYDLEGKPLEKGTAQESWNEAEGKKVSIVSPSFSEGQTLEVDYKTHNRESYLVHQAINDLVRPFPATTKRMYFALSEFDQLVGTLECNCFSITQPGKSRPPEAPAYCMDADNHIAAVTGPLFVLERSDFRNYHVHQIPNELRLSYEGRIALTMHVTELDPLPSPMPSMSKAKLVQTATRVPAEYLASHMLKKKDPTYPKEAKKKRIAGSVLISAIITKEGTLTAMDIIASPDPLLTKAALDAVQTWTYSPYLINGAPVEVDTTITVNFNIGK